MKENQKKYFKILGRFLMFMLAATIISRALTAMGLPRVSTAKAEPSYIVHTLKSSGTVEPNGEVGVYALKEQLVKKVNINVGDTVAKGDVLLEIDLDKLAADIATKEREIAKLQLQIDDELNQKTITDENKNREIRQAEEAYNHSVQSANDNIARAEADLNAAIARFNAEENAEVIDSLRSEIEQKEAALNETIKAGNNQVLSAAHTLETARGKTATSSTDKSLKVDMEQINKEKDKLLKLEKSKGEIKAPTAGVVTNINTETGEITSEAAVIRLADTTNGYRYKTQINKDDNKYISVGQEVVLTPSGAGSEIKGCTVESIMTSSEAADKLDVVVLVSAKACNIGESLEMAVSQKNEKYSRCLPVSAIFEENSEKFIYVLEESNTILGEVPQVKKHQVTILDKNETTVAISEDSLTNEQQVIISTDKTLQNNSRVRVQDDE